MRERTDLEKFSIPKLSDKGATVHKQGDSYFVVEDDKIVHQTVDKDEAFRMSKVARNKATGPALRIVKRGLKSLPVIGAGMSLFSEDASAAIDPLSSESIAVDRAIEDPSSNEYKARIKKRSQRRDSQKNVTKLPR